MRERLSHVAEVINPRRFRADSLARRQAEGPGEAPDLVLAFAYTEEGRIEEAIVEIERVRAVLANTRGRAARALDLNARRLLATVYFLLAEQENCFVGSSPDVCLLPLEGGGRHEVRRGAEAAAALLEEVLAEDPTDLFSQWLLNVAHMALGSYPGGVPQPFGVPPDVFASEDTIGRFVNVAPDLGLDVWSCAGGSVADDLDGDGLLDLMVSGLGLADPIRMFRNLGDGRFEDRTEAAGLSGLHGGLNLVHADYDNDGDNDVVVLRGAWFNYIIGPGFGNHPNSLLRNLGDGRFEDVTEVAGVLQHRPGQTASWADFDRDGWLDLFVGGESFVFNTRLQKKFGEVEDHPCALYRNNGDGTFTDVAKSRGVADLGYVKGAIWTDIDNDGWEDLVVSVYEGDNLILRNPGEGGGWFESVGKKVGVEGPHRSFPTWTWDYDNDGWLDLFIAGYSSFKNRANDDILGSYLGLPLTETEYSRLYRNRGDGTFEDVSERCGVDRGIMTMGCNFGDLDNDGWLDFYLGTGMPNVRTLTSNRMFRSDRGQRFLDVTVVGGFGHAQKGHGVSFADFDNDGDQDIYQQMGGFFPGNAFSNVLFENPGHGRHWVSLRLVGTHSNRSAIGARVRLEVGDADERRFIHRRVGSGGSFGGSPLRLEVGLGDADRVRQVEIRWPRSGVVERHGPLDAGAFYEIVEGKPEARRLELPVMEFARRPDARTGSHRHHH